VSMATFGSSYRLSDVQKIAISPLYKTDKSSRLVFSGDFSFNHHDFLTPINYVSSYMVIYAPNSYTY